jgi:cyclohexanone monooxygenase
VLICATGFNACVGAYQTMHIAGRDGMTLHDHWRDWSVPNMGVAVSGFLNMFIILGLELPVRLKQ